MSLCRRCFRPSSVRRDGGRSEERPPPTPTNRLGGSPQRGRDGLRFFLAPPAPLSDRVFLAWPGMVCLACISPPSADLNIVDLISSRQPLPTKRAIIPDGSYFFVPRTSSSARSCRMQMMNPCHQPCPSFHLSPHLSGSKWLQFSMLLLQLRLRSVARDRGKSLTGLVLCSALAPLCRTHGWTLGHGTPRALRPVQQPSAPQCPPLTEQCSR